MLTTIKHYLKERDCASLAEIAYYLNSDPDAVRGMLEQWIRRGKIQRIKPAACGTKCTKCDPEITEIYRWIEAGNTQVGLKILPPKQGVK